MWAAEAWKASQKGSWISQKQGRSERCWWWPRSAESLVVSAVVEWKSDLGSYLGWGENPACHEWGLGSLFWCRNTVGKCACYRASICHFCDISGKQTMSDWLLTAWCCQNSHGPGGLKQPGAACHHWGWELWFGSTALGLGKVGCEKSYRKLRSVGPVSPWQGLSKTYSWSKTVCSVCHFSLTVESLPPSHEG